MQRVVVALVCAVLTSLSLSAQRKAAPAVRRAERNVPFRVGETLTYDVSWSAYVTAGTAVATVKEKKPSFNSTAYYVVAEGRPTPLVSKLYSLYYKMDSLIDSYTLLPQRGSIYSEEGKRHRFRTTLFDARNQRVGRNTAMWMSDDARRLPVQLRADLPIGSFNLALREAR